MEIEQICECVLEVLATVVVACALILAIVG